MFHLYTVSSLNREHCAQVEEDDRVHGRAEHLAEVVDGDQAVLVDVSEAVVGLEKAAYWIWIEIPINDPNPKSQTSSSPIELSKWK